MKEQEKIRREEYYENAKLAYAALMLFYPFNIEDLEGEIWKWIKNYEGLYQISNYGRIKSFPREFEIDYKKITIRKPILNKRGYLRVTLYKNNIGEMFPIHRLVAQTFIPNFYNKPCVNHKDGNKLNNCVENLEWATIKENNAHALEIGHHQSGVNAYNSKLTEENVKYIRQFYILGDKNFGVNALSKKFNISRACIQDVIKGKSYKNIDEDKGDEKIE